MIKITSALKKRNPEWEFLLISAVPYLRSDVSSLFAEEFRYRDGRTLAVQLSRQSKVDIIHCHNEPDFETVTAIKVEIAPVIHDCHDFMTMRLNNQPKEIHEAEKFAFENCDVANFPSHRLMQYAVEKYAIKKPLVTFSSVSKDEYVTNVNPPAIAEDNVKLVYEGGIGLDKSNVFPYRKYTSEFNRLSSVGVHISVYPSYELEINNGHLGGAVIECTLGYEELIYELSSFHYGFVGFNSKDCDKYTKRYCNVALPNKMFDYFAAGIPVIVRNCDAAAEFVTMRNIGINASFLTPQETKEQMVSHYKEQRENVLIEREQFCMENEIDLIESEYKRLSCQEA